MSDHISNELSEEFKKNLKLFLEMRKGITNAKKLSLDAGLGETAVRDILKNRSTSPRLDTVQKIAVALGVGVHDLIPSLIKDSYKEIKDLRKEIKALQEELDNTYATLEDSLSAVKKRRKTSSTKK
tara:strand:- start:705 stop:1082 length:378 start_codon:yes stop_codon:yes gene_type:complete